MLLLFYLSLDNQLSEMERRHGLATRWKPGDKQYEEMKLSLISENQGHVRSTLWSCVVKRHYLLRMKAKYAGAVMVLHVQKI